MAFGYLDQYEILHIVDEETTAKKFAKDGKYVSTDVTNSGGYPTVSDGKGGQTAIIVYAAEGVAYINGNRENGAEVKLSDYPEVQALVNELK